jgi:hypothetical protein
VLSCVQSLGWVVGLTTVGGGLYYAKENGMLDGFLGAPATTNVRLRKRSPLDRCHWLVLCICPCVIYAMTLMCVSAAAEREVVARI